MVIEGSQLTHANPGESENILRSLFEEALLRSKEADDGEFIVHCFFFQYHMYYKIAFDRPGFL